MSIYQDCLCPYKDVRASSPCLFILCSADHCNVISFHKKYDCFKKKSMTQHLKNVVFSTN